MKTVACYIRVSTDEEDQAKQRREINHWLKSHRINQKTVRWYIDKSTDDAKSKLIPAGIVVAVLVLVIFYLVGKRVGRTESTVVEIRRI